MSPTTRLRRTLALVLAGGALAIGVPAALAAGGGDSGSGSGGAATPDAGFVQDDRSGQARPDHDCPERGGDNGGGSGSGEQGADDAATTTPAV
jgi:hypothetical protein